MLLNLDGLVGQTHHFGGLAEGNLASALHAGQQSNPRQAALQGLEKMWRLHQLGFAQAVLPPAQRPDLALLRAAGFHGDDNSVLYQASRKAPELLSACYSASSMWAANAATITCAEDAGDSRTHITPANLISSLHRSLESTHNSRVLRRIFPEQNGYTHHPPLPGQFCFSDEGAANHIRLSDPGSQRSLNLFIYGRDDKQSLQPGRYPARQSMLASESIIRQHQLPDDRYMLIQQNPAAINAGAFHNDVIAVGFENLLLLHTQAFANQQQVLEAIHRRTADWSRPLQIIVITEQQLGLAEAIKCYLFNSQLLRLPSGGFLLVAPADCHASPAALQTIDDLLQGPIAQVIYFNLRESMNNGGGPACLRLAVPLPVSGLSGIHPGIIMTDKLYQQLQDWVICHYRDQLRPSDLADPVLRREAYAALDALTDILNLPGLYTFQESS